MLTVDWQTLFTHNHTIICCSLEEGLTYSCCAYHALADCHKKYDCAMRGQARPCAVKALNVFSRSLYWTRSNWNLALLAHIYAKVAICKSCERVRPLSSRKHLSPGNQRFRTSTARAPRRGMVTVSAWSPAEICTSVMAARPSSLVPRSPIKYPPRWRPRATPGVDT